MALADLDAFTAALQKPQEGATLVFCAPSTATTIGRMSDFWALQVPGAATPTSAVAPTRTSAGFAPQNGSGTLSIIGARLQGSGPMTYIIADRLSHQGSLSGTVTTAQTTNLPTAALTRYTSGVGVMIGLTIYSIIGTTGTTVSASYTNQAGTSGRTTPLVVFGGTGFREAGRMILLPLQAGDNGVQSVESVTVTASTGTAGNFGVTLFKPLTSIIATDQHGVIVADFITGHMGGGIPEIVDDACLFPLCISMTTVGNAVGNLFTTEH